MARQDTILNTFLSHKLLREKYHLSQAEQSMTLRDALQSLNPIVKAIALIIEYTESNPPATDATIRTIITNYLATAAI